VPVENAAAVHGADEIRQQPKSYHEQHEHHEIERVMDNVVDEGDEEDEGEEESETGDNLSIDKPLVIPSRLMSIGMKPCAGETCDGGRESDLANAEE